MLNCQYFNYRLCPVTFQTILANHQSRYPLMQARDVYKLIHQAVLGSEHAIPNPQTARTRLDEELQRLANPHPEPAIDPISPDGEMVRVHLFAFVAQGGQVEHLLESFLRTGREYHGASYLLETYLQAAVPLVPDLRDILPSLQVQGYPALHHSAAYREHYCPAYRVVFRKFLVPLVCK
jgi:hypothetical protein